MYAPFSEYGAITKALEERGIEILTSGFERIPMDTKAVTPEQQADVEKLLEKSKRTRTCRPSTTQWLVKQPMVTAVTRLCGWCGILPTKQQSHDDQRSH